MLTTYGIDEYVFAALHAGASGFLLKDTPPADLLAAIRVVAAGEALLGTGGHPPADRGVHPPTRTDGAGDRAERPHGSGTRGADPGGTRPFQLRDRRTPARQPVDCEDPHRPAADEARRTRPRAAGHRRIPGGTRPPLTPAQPERSDTVHCGLTAPGPAPRRPIASLRGGRRLEPVEGAPADVSGLHGEELAATVDVLSLTVFAVRRRPYHGHRRGLHTHDVPGVVGGLDQDRSALILRTGERRFRCSDTVLSSIGSGVRTRRPKASARHRRLVCDGARWANELP